MTPDPTRRITPVEVFVGAGVLAAAWGLVGRMAIPFGLIGLAVAATVAGLRSGGRDLWPASFVSLLPALALVLLAALVALAHAGGPKSQGPLLALLMALGTSLIVSPLYGCVCLLRAARPTHTGSRRAWLMCALSAFLATTGTGLLLWMRNLPR